MKRWKHVSAALVGATTLVVGASEKEITSMKDRSWTLKTDDTHLGLTVRDNKPFITVLKNPAQDWNWTPKPSEVPLLERVVVGGAPRPLTWNFREATTASDKTGTTLTLRFTSVDPVLELKSVWRARPGVGPVEHQATIRNNSQEPVSFADADLVAADLAVVADQPPRLFPVPSGKLGHGEGNPLPYQMIQVAKAHGVYLAYDYGCGQFVSTVTSNQIASRWWAAGIKNTVTAPGETFRCPGMMIQTYQGDEDDGANRFRRWFWTYEITRSLYETPTDPPIGTCEYTAETDARPDLYIEWIKKRNYADWGVRLWKTDAWHMQTGHARSAELAEVCRANGLELCMYWNGRRTEEELVAEWNKSKFNYYRTDDYGAGPPFFVNDYRSFMDFNRKIDSLYRKYGIKYENCSNGGNIRTLDVFRRMTWMTHSDHSDLGPFFRHVYAWSYLMCPIQLRSDYNHLFEDVANIRGQLLGSILLSLYNKATPMSDIGNERVKRVFHLYNTRQRPILRGADVYHILPPLTQKNQWFGLQYYNTFINKGSVLLWQNGGPASQVVKLKGLDRAATYALAFEDAPEKNSARTGAQLMDEGLNVTMGPNASEIVWINCDVTAAIAVDTVRGEQPLPVRFDGSGSSSSTGKIVSHEWAFGDGATAREVATAHTYDKPGRYKVRLTVRDDQGRRDTAFASVTVLPTDTVAPEINAVRPVRSDRVVVALSEPVLKEDAETASNYAITPDVKVMAVSPGEDGRTVTLTTSPLSRGVEYALTARNIRDHARKPNAVAPDARTTFRYFGLYGRWKLDEGSGRAAADVSGNGLGGQLQGGVGWSARNGRVAASFDGGKNSVMAIPGCKETLVLPFTISFRVNPAAQKSATMFAPGEGKPFSMLFRAEQGLETAGVSGSEGAEEYLGVVIEKDGSINLLVGLGERQENLEDAPKSVPLAAGQWQDVALTFNDRKAVCYVDGKEKGSLATKALLARLSEPACKLGQRITVGRQFRGLLSDVRIYRLALSAAELRPVMK